MTERLTAEIPRGTFVHARHDVAVRRVVKSLLGWIPVDLEMTDLRNGVRWDVDGCRYVVLWQWPCRER